MASADETTQASPRATIRIVPDQTRRQITRHPTTRLGNHPLGPVEPVRDNDILVTANLGDMTRVGDLKVEDL